MGRILDALKEERIEIGCCDVYQRVRYIRTTPSSEGTTNYIVCPMCYGLAYYITKKDGYLSIPAIQDYPHIPWRDEWGKEI